MRYVRRCDDFALVDEGENVLFSTPEVALGFSKSGVLHQHGPTAAVEAWLTDARRKYRRAGYQSMADELVMLVSDTWNLDELNKCLTISGYVGQLFDRLQSKLVEYERPQTAMTDFEKAEKVFRVAPLRGGEF